MTEKFWKWLNIKSYGEKGLIWNMDKKENKIIESSNDIKRDLENVYLVIKQEVNKKLYKYYGLRIDVRYKKKQCSRRWCYGKPQKTYLSGLSVLDITQYGIDKCLKESISYRYPEEKLFLVGSNKKHSGQDLYESIFDKRSHKLICELEEERP